MREKINFNKSFTIIMVTLMSISLLSCSGDNDTQLDNGSHNITDVAVTSNLSKLGVTYAYIDGYVNLNLITSSYTSQQIGIELSMNEEFDNVKRVITKELEGNKLTIIIDTLSATTKYYYRTFVKVNDLNYYGEKRSFTTKDFSNITSTGEASELTFTSANIKCYGDASSIDSKNRLAIGIAYSTSKSRLHPDSAYIYGQYSKSFNIIECPIDSIIKKKTYERIISSLQNNTTYYYCSFTRAGRKFKFGEIKNFSTKTLSEAQLYTGDATDITLTSATIKNTSAISNLYPKETSIEYGIRYGVTQDVLSQRAYATTQQGEDYIVHLQDLTDNKTYYYCAYASVDGITLTGKTKSFTTKSRADYLSTGKASDITQTSAMLSGTTTLSSIYPNTSIQYSIRYTTTISNLTSTYSTSSINVLPNENNLSVKVSNLKSETTYYYCVVANVNGYYIFGEAKSFTTKARADSPKGSGTQTDPYNAAAANRYIASLAANTESDKDIYIKGKLVKYANNNQFNVQYGNASFYLSDDGTEDCEQFFVFRTLYLGNVKYSDDSWAKPKAGDEIIICGKLVNYKGNTPETVANQSYIYSLNGQTAGGSGESGGGSGNTGNTGADGSTIISVADFNAAAVSTDVWYQLTGTIKNLKDGDQYGNFDLEDATGSVYVYGVLSEKGGAKKQFQDLVTAKGIANGKTITIVGTRGEYNGKIEVMNAYFIKVE